MKDAIAGSALRVCARSLWAAILAAGLLAMPAAARTSACQVHIDGRDVRTATDPATPLLVRLDQRVVVDAVVDQPADSIKIDVEFGPFTASVYENPAPPPGTVYRETIDGRPYAVFGAGLYRVVATIDDCALQSYVKVETDPPLVTIAGGIGLGLLIVGVGLGLSSLLTVLRGGKAWIRSIIAGVLVGASSLLVVQQLGFLPIDIRSIAVFVVVPGFIGVGLLALALALSGGPAASAGAGIPTAMPPSVPYGTPSASLPTAPPSVAYGSPPPGPLSGPPAGPTIPATPTTAPIGATAAPSSGAGGFGGAGTAPDARAQPEDAAREGADPPRESYARLECEDILVVARDFELRVGLSPTPDAHVAGGPMRRPATSVGPYVVTIQVVADGFGLTRSDETWRVDLPVTAEAPYPSATLHLAALAQQERVVARSVRGMFSVEGQPIGLAVRPVAVVASPSLVGQAPVPVPQPAVDLRIPLGEAPPDLTVRIELGDGTENGRLLWQMLAADPNVTVPDAPLEVRIGNEPRDFLRFVIQEMNLAEGAAGVYPKLRGIGVRIADNVPQEFFTVLTDVASRVKERPVAVLILSAEPYVPWELMVLDQPLDPSAPPFLSAQVDVGRWVLGQRRPKLPPPAKVEVHSMAVVSGVYDVNPAWQRLVDAEQEAAELEKTYKATAVDANTAAVARLLEGDPQSDLMHFAVHGQYDPAGEIDGLVLVDGPLDPTQVTGTELSGAPFVFLNACQVGAANQVLGDYAGMAEAFLYGGAAAVVAPLWSIDDVGARELALQFYQRALTGEAPAAVLRSQRKAFQKAFAPISSTSLAYQFYGHPRMTISAMVPGLPAVRQPMADPR